MCTRKKENAESAAREKLLRDSISEHQAEMKFLKEKLAALTALAAARAEPKQEEANPFLSSSLLKQVAGVSAGIFL
jgi:hypothetical protein